MQTYVIGDTWSPVLTVTENGAPKDLSQATVLWAIKGASSAYPVESLPITGTGANGSVSATVTPAVTELVPPGRYRESFQITAGQEIRTFSRDIRVVKSIF